MATAFYGNVKLEGPANEVEFILALIRKAEAESVRTPAQIKPTAKKGAH